VLVSERNKSIRERDSVRVREIERDIKVLCNICRVTEILKAKRVREY
jgi:hypothetical protein